MHTYMHAKFAALITFFGNFRSYAHSLLCAYLWWHDQSMCHEHSDGWQDRKVCFTDILPNSISLICRSSFGWCTFSALIWLAPGAEAKLQRTSEKPRWMWMQKNTPVPRLNKGIYCQEKGDKSFEFWAGWPPPGSATAARMNQVITTLWSHTLKVEEWNRHK